MAPNSSYDSNEDHDVPMEEVGEGLVVINDGDLDSHLWGYLSPMQHFDPRIDFWKIQPTYTFGRGQHNDMCFPDFGRMSTNHCIIRWGGEYKEGSVTVEDLSLNGTFKNGEIIGKNQVCVLKDGDEIAFPNSLSQAADTRSEKHRYIFRQLLPVLTKGLYAEYELAEVLGDGASGVVKRAMHKASQKWYAVKMISLARAPEDQREAALERLVHEVRVMESLSHRNVCLIYQHFICIEDDNVNIVLEYVQGGDLRNYTTNEYPRGIPEHQVKDMVSQICDGMAYIHSQGITHRDLKPENILLNRTVSPPLVKVADFGLSKELPDLYSVVGTPICTAPEVVRNRPYNNLVDSFGLGCVMFFMLMGEDAYFEDSEKLAAMGVHARDTTRRVNLRGNNLDDMTVGHVSENVCTLVKENLLLGNSRKRYSMIGVIKSSWLLGFTPHCGWSTWLEAKLRDTATVAPTPPQTPRSKGKGRARDETPGRVRSKALVRGVRIMGTLPEESSSSAETGDDGDTEMMPATPVRRITRAHPGLVAGPSETPIRRSRRIRKALFRLEEKMQH